jgi:hypothetical protein
VAELGVDHGGSRRWHLESALVSAMVALDGGARTRPSVAAIGYLLWRRWGPSGVLVCSLAGQGRRCMLNQGGGVGSCRERETSEGGEWLAETVRASDPTRSGLVR